MPKNDDKTRFIKEMLLHVPFDGWSEPAVDAALRGASLSRDWYLCSFAEGIPGGVAGFLDMVNAEMVEALSVPPAPTRLSDRVSRAVMTRLEVLSPNREAVRRTLAWLAMPLHWRQSLDALTTTVDTIWRASGDASTGFDYYTKRLTLGSVYAATELFWLSDESTNLEETRRFLARRLENVHTLGKAVSKVKQSLGAARI